MHRRNPSMDYTGAFSPAALFSIPLARFVRQGETRERPSDTKEESSPRISLDAQSGRRLPCDMPHSDECRVLEVDACRTRLRGAYGSNGHSLDRPGDVDLRPNRQRSDLDRNGNSPLAHRQVGLAARRAKLGAWEGGQSPGLARASAWPQQPAALLDGERLPSPWRVLRRQLFLGLTDQMTRR